MKGNSYKTLTADPYYCVGCKGCELACASDHEGVTNIMVVQKDNLKIPAYCRHCKEAYCLLLCPAKAITKKEGVVILNEKKCTGCGICEQGCPYGVITMIVQRNDEGKRKTLAVKCDSCSERQKNEGVPLCFEACPTGALSLV